MKQINFTILLTVLMGMVGAKAFAYDVSVKNEDGVTIYYNYINNSTELEVTSGPYNYSGNVKIPESVTTLNKTRSVTRIGDKAFYQCKMLSSVTIPASVTSIGYGAFYACILLKKVIVKDIGAWCNISFDNDYSNPLYSAHHLYSDEDTEIVDLVIPDGVTSIGNYAFYNCEDLNSATIPASVTSIGSYAFNSCNGLTSITFSGSVTSIGNFAFQNCNGLKKVIVKDIGAWCGLSFNDWKSNPLYYAEHLYSDEDTEIVDLVIPDGVTSIGKYVFSYCSGLTSVTIPTGVTSIGSYAFYGCDGLNAVTIPASMTSIGYEAFNFCYGLKKVIVKDISAWCGISFYDRESNPFYYAEHLYSDKDTEIVDLVIPDGVTSIGEYAFYGCDGLNSVTIPASVTSIGYYAFYSDNLAEIVSLIQEPFRVWQIVTDFIYNNGTLYVPEGTIEKYKATDGWKEFIWMEEGLPTGIKHSNAPNATETQRYTIGGQSIKNPQRGLNIIKMSDGKTKKVMVK